MSHRHDEMKRELAVFLEHLMRRKDVIDDYDFLYDIPDQYTYNPCTPNHYRMRHNIFRRYYDVLKDRGPISALEYMFRDFAELTQYTEKLSRQEADARKRVEHWNRIESNVRSNQAVLEAWKEFRVHYKLSTGEDLPPLGDDNV